MPGNQNINDDNDDDRDDSDDDDSDDYYDDDDEISLMTCLCGQIKRRRSDIDGNFDSNDADDDHTNNNNDDDYYGGDYEGTNDDDSRDINLMACLFEDIKRRRSNVDDERFQLRGT